MNKVKKSFLFRFMLCLILTFGVVSCLGINNSNVKILATNGSGSNGSGSNGSGSGSNGSGSNAGPTPFTYDEQYKDASTEYDNSGIKDIASEINPEKNQVTELISNPAQGFMNTIMFVVINLIEVFFFLQTCFDILFLIAPGFRGILTSHQDKATAGGKAVRMCTGLISEAALNAVGYKKTVEKGERHIQGTNISAEVDWKGWVVRRLGMFIGIMAYLALLIMGLLDEFVALFSKLAYALVKALMNLLTPES